jgi:hypothetical protein
MKKKTKELIKDITFMIWGFIGSCSLGSLIVLKDAGYLTGNMILVTDYASGGLILGSMGILVYSILIASGYRLWKK